MATAEGVKNKINNLISAANGKTGNSDPTLTAAVNRLIAGYGQGSGSGITPTGTIKITENGDYDVTSYANANVAIPEVEQAVPEITVNEDGRIGYTITQEEGYVAGGTKFGSQTQPTKGAATIQPGVTEQVAVAKGLFTTGDVKVAGDANLVGGNIKKGVSIFGVTGSYDAGGSSTTLPDVAQATPTITVSSGGLITASSTQEAGVVAAGTKTATRQLTTVSGKTVTPGTSEQVVVPAGRYTTGDIKVSAVPEAEAGIEADALSDIHYWEKYVSGSDLIAETAVTDAILSYSSKLGTGDPLDSVDYADAISIVDGELVLSDPVTTIGLGSDTRSQIVGKYIYAYNDGRYYRIPTDATISYHTSTYTAYVQADKVFQLTAETGGSFLGIVVSANSAAYPENGEQDGYRYVYMGTLSNTGGGDGTLPTLTNPGSATDLATGKQLIDGSGNIVTGSLFELTSGNTLYANNNPTLSWRTDGQVETVGTYGVAGTGDGGIVRPGAKFAIRTPAEQYGDATAADVAAGKTFTSAAGLMLTGTGAGSSGLVMKTGSVTLDANTTSFDITTGLSSINALVVYNDMHGETSNTFLWVKSNVFSGRAYVDVGPYITTTSLTTTSSGVSISNGIVTYKQYSDSYPIIAGTYDWVAFGTM